MLNLIKKGLKIYGVWTLIGFTICSVVAMIGLFVRSFKHIGNGDLGKAVD